MSVLFVHFVLLRGFCMVFICFVCIIYCILTKYFHMFVSFWYTKAARLLFPEAWRHCLLAVILLCQTNSKIIVVYFIHHLFFLSRASCTNYAPLFICQFACFRFFYCSFIFPSPWPVFWYTERPLPQRPSMILFQPRELPRPHRESRRNNWITA